MKKIIYVGICKDGKACILKSFACFEKIAAEINDIEASDFVHEATNWGGCDKLDRVLNMREIKLTGRSVNLPTPIKFYGIDQDTNSDFEWSIEVTELREAKEEQS